MSSLRCRCPPCHFSRLNRPPPCPTLFPYTTLFRSSLADGRYRLTIQDGAVIGTNGLALDGDNNGSAGGARSEEHTSELQSRPHLVCRLLLEKKKKREARADQRRLADGPLGRVCSVA